MWEVRMCASRIPGDAGPGTRKTLLSISFFRGLGTFCPGVSMPTVNLSVSEGGGRGGRRIQLDDSVPSHWNSGRPLIPSSVGCGHPGGGRKGGRQCACERACVCACACTCVLMGAVQSPPLMPRPPPGQQTFNVLLCEAETRRAGTSHASCSKECLLEASLVLLVLEKQGVACDLFDTHRTQTFNE